MGAGWDDVGGGEAPGVATLRVRVLQLGEIGARGGSAPAAATSARRRTAAAVDVLSSTAVSRFLRRPPAHVLGATA